jgi:hypothetical protein
VAVTATSGKIDIQADPVSFTVSNLLPGVWSPREEITIFNTPTSTTAVKYRLTDQFGTESLAGLYDRIAIRVTHRFCGGIDSSVPYTGALKNLQVTNSMLTGGFADPLPVNESRCFWVEFKLADGTGNAFQGQTATFDLVFDATQPENPGWSE